VEPARHRGQGAHAGTIYTETLQILGLARRIAEEVVGAPGVAADDEDPVLIPEGASRQGVEPQVRRCVSIEAEGHAIAEWLLGRRKAGYQWGQMAVLYCEHWIGEKFAQVLKKREAPFDIAKENKNRANLSGWQSDCAASVRRRGWSIRASG
jgi:hypothetical protein